MEGFLNSLPTDILGQIIHCCGRCPVYCGIFNSIPGLYLPDAGSSPQLWQPQMSPDIVKCPLSVKRDETTSSWESLIYKYWLIDLYLVSWFLIRMWNNYLLSHVHSSSNISLFHAFILKEKLYFPFFRESLNSETQVE